MGDYFVVTGGANWNVPERSLNSVVSSGESLRLIPLLLVETRLFQLPTATVLLPSLLRLLVYLGLCNKEEDAMTRICELSKLAVSVAEGGAVTKL
jgi:hypothetical protein